MPPVVYWLEQRSSVPKFPNQNLVQKATTRDKSCASSTLWYYAPNITHLLESEALSVIQVIGRQGRCMESPVEGTQ